MGRSQYRKLDWVIVGCFLFLVIFGWMNIYSASTAASEGLSFLNTNPGKQIIWITTSFVLVFLILFIIPYKIYNAFAWWLYAFMLILLVVVIFVGSTVHGSKSWIDFGFFKIQPAEFSKITTSLALATLMQRYDFKFSKRMDAIKAFAIMVLPMLLIVMEKETGSSLVYIGFLLMFFREGMTGWILIGGVLSVALFLLTLLVSPFTAMIVLLSFLCLVTIYYAETPLRKKEFHLLICTASVILISFLPRLLNIEFIAKYIHCPPETCLLIITVPVALAFAIIFAYKRIPLLRNMMVVLILGMTMIFSFEFAFEKVLKPHQRLRIESLLGIKDDPMGVGYNVHQSMIAIGSGGFIGKGFLNGTQTRFDFVPEQSTDFIFCTIGEEWGFVGALAVIVVYITIIVRIFRTADKMKDNFNRVFGYCVACSILMHVFINISMTIGLMPVIGIPLPFLSYGGSSLWAFSILLFIYVRLELEEANR